MNHYFKCIDIWYTVSLGPGDSGFWKWILWRHKWPRAKG